MTGSSPVRTFTRSQARRIALGAQGFARARPAKPGLAQVRSTAHRLGVIQMDAVNVVERAHYLPCFSRLGPYPREALDRLAYGRRELFEYWGHEASLLPVETHRLLRWRMADPGSWWYATWSRQNAALIEAVAAEVEARGPSRVGDLADPGAKKGPWWGWSDGKRAMEALFHSGRVTTVERRNFERVYDLTERVLPAEVLDGATPPEDEAKSELLLRAARALGIATAADLADYFRLNGPAARPLVEALADDGALERVRVEGWRDVAYLDPEARHPRTVRARALLSPFDNLIFNRKRVERLFDFRYRVEIYVPEREREFGYYVFPFLRGEALVARVDLKADRKAGQLLVRGAWIEDGADAAAVAPALADELALMAGWLGLDGVKVGRRGTLSGALRRAVRIG